MIRPRDCYYHRTLDGGRLVRPAGPHGRDGRRMGCGPGSPPCLRRTDHGLRDRGPGASRRSGRAQDRPDAVGPRRTPEEQRRRVTLRAPITKSTAFRSAAPGRWRTPCPGRRTRGIQGPRRRSQQQLKDDEARVAVSSSRQGVAAPASRRSGRPRAGRRSRARSGRAGRRWETSSVRAAPRRGQNPAFGPGARRPLAA